MSDRRLQKAYPELPISMHCVACGSSDKSINYIRQGASIPYKDKDNPPNKFAVRGVQNCWEAGCAYLRYKCNTCNYGWITLPHNKQLEEWAEASR